MNPDFLRRNPSMLLAYTAIGLGIVVGIILARWLMSAQAWKQHPGGAGGFLWDEFLRLGAIYLPFAALLLGVRYYVYEVRPELARSPLLYGVILTFFVFRRLARLLPFAKAAGDRLDAARAAAKT